MKIAVLGSGNLGEALADGLRESGFEVMRASREPARLAAWKRRHKGRIGTFAEAAVWGDTLVLAVRGVSDSALAHGKPVIDANECSVDELRARLDRPASSQPRGFARTHAT